MSHSIDEDNQIEKLFPKFSKYIKIWLNSSVAKKNLCSKHHTSRKTRSVFVPPPSAFPCISLYYIHIYIYSFIYVCIYISFKGFQPYLSAGKPQPHVIVIIQVRHLTHSLSWRFSMPNGSSYFTKVGIFSEKNDRNFPSETLPGPKKGEVVWGRYNLTRFVCLIFKVCPICIRLRWETLAIYFSTLPLRLLTDLSLAPCAHMKMGLGLLVLVFTYV